MRIAEYHEQDAGNRGFCHIPGYERIQAGGEQLLIITEDASQPGKSRHVNSNRTRKDSQKGAEHRSSPSQSLRNEAGYNCAKQEPNQIAASWPKKIGWTGDGRRRTREHRKPGSQAKAGVAKWIAFYNYQRPHAAHGGQPPAVVYFTQTETDQQGQRVA